MHRSNETDDRQTTARNRHVSHIRHWYNGPACVHCRSSPWSPPPSACSRRPLRHRTRPRKLVLSSSTCRASSRRSPTDDAQLAASRDLNVSELPGRGLGLHAAAQVYLLRWKAVTFGIGGELTMVRASKDSQEVSDGVFSRATTEQFTHVAPQLSFNFGDGDGWSYHQRRNRALHLVAWSRPASPQRRPTANG